MIDNAGCPEPLVLRFYRTRTGDLSCRVTEPATNKTWVVQSAEQLRELIYYKTSADARQKD
jgi:hypothetical protein